MIQYMYTIADIHFLIHTLMLYSNKKNKNYKSVERIILKM